MKEQTKNKRAMSRDMTQGSIVKHLLLFTLPMLLGNAFQLLYNTVDSVVVGRYVGGKALAAVGTSFPDFCAVIAFHGYCHQHQRHGQPVFRGGNHDQLKKLSALPSPLPWYWEF